MVIKNSKRTSGERKFRRTIGYGIARVNSAKPGFAGDWKKPKGMVSAGWGPLE
ncbi:MAG: hypothetical protein IJ127_16650 [Afipia sp.]|nr:hypothetical protein [Afipia sp.]MBS4002236.1 hypothetical protein [Afipia sp.]